MKIAIAVSAVNGDFYSLLIRKYYSCQYFFFEVLPIPGLKLLVGSSTL